MKYNLNNLNPYDFEGLVQSISRKIIGNGVIAFGEGTDGGREASFEGKAPYPSVLEAWDGYWVIQAKYKTINTPEEEKDFKWVETQLRGELDKYSTRIVHVKMPNNYLLFTNIVLTAKAKTGGRDKATLLERSLEKKYKIKNIKIISCGDIQNYLDSYKDIRIAYAAFILPGDILNKLLELIDVKKERIKRINETLGRFLESEFREDAQSKLDHAGKLTQDKINLEKVFIDLNVIDEEHASNPKTKFIINAISKCDTVLKYKPDSAQRSVLKAGPGYGKSTLTQFLVQIYRAYFLRDVDNCAAVMEEIDLFLKDIKDIIESEPKCIRLPIKIVLKNYAGWIRDSKKKDSKSDISVLKYITNNINNKAGSGDLTFEEVENVIINFPSIFIFDGLDEVPASSNRGEVLREIFFFTDIFLRRNVTDSLIIATTRPQGYSRELDANKYKHYLIADLEKDDCKLYLKRLLDKIIDDEEIRKSKYDILCKSLSNKETSRLMKSPLQASIMAILVKSGGEPSKNKFDLFSEYYEIIFRREKQNNIASILVENPIYIDVIHDRLGLYLQKVSEIKSNPSASIEKDLFENLITLYLKSIGLNEDDIARKAGQILSASTDRLVFISEISDSSYGFTIRSLQEFFAARGYIHNVQDSLTKDKLLEISTSSYWGNTWLFVIGYLAKNKPYLVDIIESTCNVLNGSMQDKTSKRSLTSILNLGSWMALSVLNEGIFKSIPNNENIFCNQIEPLFYMPWSKKHMELVNLPDSLIEKWVVKYITEALLKSNKNITAWLIAVNLSNKGIDTSSALDKYWPTEIQAQYDLIGLLVNKKYHNDYIILKFIELIPEASKKDLWCFFNNNYFNFLLDVCESKFNTNKTYSILLEMIVIKMLNEHGARGDYGLLLNKIIDNGTDIERSKKRVSLTFPETEVPIVQGFSAIIHNLPINRNAAFEHVLKLLEVFDVKLPISIISYLVDPQLKSFLSLHGLIYQLDDTYREIVTKELRLINSFFKVIFQQGKRLTNIELKKEYQEFIKINTKTWELEKLGKYLTGWLFRHESVENQLGKLEQFKNEYLDDLSQEIAIEYVILFQQVFYIIREQDALDQLSKRGLSELYQNCIDSLENLKENDRYPFIDMSVLLYVVKDLNEFNGLYPEIKEKAAFKAYNELSVKVIDVIARNIGRLIQLQILLKKNPFYNLISEFIDNRGHPNLAMDFVPFKKIADYRHKEEDEINKTIVLLLDKKFNLKSLEVFKNTFRKISLESGMLDALLTHFRYAPNNSYIEEAIVLIHGKMNDNVDVKLMSDFEDFAQEYLGQGPTGLEIEQYETINL